MCYVIEFYLIRVVKSNDWFQNLILLKNDDNKLLGLQYSLKIFFLFAINAICFFLYF